MDMLKDMEKYLKAVKHNSIKKAQLQTRNWCKLNSNNKDIKGMMALSENGSVIAYIKDEKSNEEIAIASIQSGNIVLLKDDGEHQTRYRKRKK